MATKDTSGPAFPKPHTVVDANNEFFKLGSDGMSLRMWLAGQALAGMLANSENGYALDSATTSAFQIADEAFVYADAVIAASTK